jgi:subtilase family serine protease
VAFSLASPSSAQGLGARGATIAKNTPGFIKNARDLGPVDPSTVISVTAWLKLHNEQRLDRLVAQQYTKADPNFHKWVTQDQFNAQFAPTSKELKAVQNWLNAHRLKTVDVAENNLYVKVQGTVADVEQTFHVQIDNFDLNGQTFRSNTNDPSINDSSGQLVAAITGLDDFGFEPNHVPAREPDGTPFPMVPLARLGPNGLFFEGQCLFGVQTHTFTGTGVSATYTGNRYGADINNTALGTLPPCGYQPSEMQTAYNMKALYATGLNGSGETIVIVDAYGSPTIAEDAAVFSTVYGLPPIDLQLVRAPGLQQNPHGAARGWDLETTLDVEWAHAMAPGAKVALVVATDRASLDEAINYAVVHHLGNTISNSWSTIEGLGNPKQLDRVNRILQMAAAQGIDVNFVTGDFGDETVRVGFKSVDFPASSPFATAIGGTSLFLNPDNTMAFQTGWGNNLTRIANTVAEGSTPVDPPLHLGFQGGAGGGSSLTFAKPDFQSSLAGTTRQVPDISMLADPFTGAEFIQTVGGVLSVGVIGGTSLACPMFSGVMAIAAQKNGSPLGQAAALVYTLPAGAVYDVLAVSSPTNVTGSITDSGGTTAYSAANLAAPLENTISFFSALYNSPFSTRWFVLTFGTDTSLTTGPGWDNVTGVGTPNGVNFVNAIAP